MTFVAAAIGGLAGYGIAGTLTGAAIGAGIGGMVGGGVNQASAAKDAAAMQAGATSNAAELQRQTALDSIAFQKEMFQKQLELGQPYREAGYGGLTQLNKMLPSLTSPITEADIANMPGYQFAVKQGTGGAMQGMNVGGGGSNVQRAGRPVDGSRNGDCGNRMFVDEIGLGATISYPPPTLSGLRKQSRP